MESEGPLSHSQEHTNGPYLDQNLFISILTLFYIYT
jgi:hypothetical protein